MTKPDSAGPDPETPGPATPRPGTPDAGTPAPGTPEPGTPDAGTPAPETPAPGIPEPQTPAPETPELATPRPGAPDPAGPAPSPDASAAGVQPFGADAPADDEAVWLDLVARLEGVADSGPDDRIPLEESADDGGTAGGGGTPGAGAPAARAFRDFDPLGLSGAAPIELSAAERFGPRPAAPAIAGGNDVQDSGAGPRDYEPDDDGAFIPEEPPSLVGADPMTVLAWIGAVGGPIGLVLSAMFWRSAPMLAILGMVAVFAAAVVFLIMKLPGEKDEHDDGARV